MHGPAALPSGDARADAGDDSHCINHCPEKPMNRLVVALLSSLVIAQVHAQDGPPVAGATTVGVAVARVQDVALGFSARKQILGHEVVNADGDLVGKVDDLIVSPDMSVTYAIVGVGGFLGVKRHHVAIPVDQFTRRNDAFLLAEATRELIKSLPAFDYAEP
jgi:sporulation protein YlmC with PRC-barrel domain